MIENILDTLSKILIKFGLKSEQKQSLEEKNKENERKKIEKEKAFKNLKLIDMIEYYNYMKNHYTKHIKNLRDNKNGWIFVILEIGAFAIMIFIDCTNFKITGDDFYTTFITVVKYLTVCLPVIALIINFRNEKFKAEIEYKEKQNELKWEIFDLADELTENNMLTDESKKALKDTFNVEFSNENNDND